MTIIDLLGPCYFFLSNKLIFQLLQWNFSYGTSQLELLLWMEIEAKKVIELLIFMEWANGIFLMRFIEMAKKVRIEILVVD